MRLAGILDGGGVPGYGFSILGVGFFAPFFATCYFFPWTPIEVSPIGVRSCFGATGMRIIGNEMLYLWLPLAGFWLLASLVRLLWGRSQKA